MGDAVTADRPALAGRKPRLLFRLPGEFLLRLAERQLDAELFQLPPRLTRLDAPACVLAPLAASGRGKSCCRSELGASSLMVSQYKTSANAEPLGAPPQDPRSRSPLTGLQAAEPRPGHSCRAWLSG